MRPEETNNNSAEGKIKTGNIYNLNQIDNGLA